MPKRPKNYPKKGTNDASTSQTRVGESKDTHDIESVKEAFETTKIVGPLKWEVKIRRRMHMDAHAHSDIVFEVRLDPARPSDKSVEMLTILDKIYHSLHDMVNHLRKHFDDSQRRVVFISITSNSLESNLYFGHEDLHNPHSEISNKLLQMFFAVLMSNKELSLEDGFQIHVVLLGKSKTISSYI